ncbi:MAG: aminotransferase class I/II-fold pyridoxal phosphate-dependent enzyme [Patescibacteria group bacterium]|jgi:dTDP-4-amino-4,6-dideoxygalactose transaminase
MITTALSPNVERDDVIQALKLIVQPWKWLNGSATEQLRNKLSIYFNNHEVILTNSGRTALLTILQALQLHDTDEVLLQAFTCNAVSNPIRWAGAKPVFVDITSETYTMNPVDLEKKITPHSKVLIIQHTFGQPANLEILLDLAKKNNLYVIEDCAHALGASYHHHQLLGTFGDAAIFSFGRDKVISSVYGGFLLLNKEQKNISQLPYPSLLWTLQQLIHPIVTKSRYSFKVFQTLGLLSLAVSQLERFGKKPKYFPARLPNALAALALVQFDKLERFNKHRQLMAKMYHDNLQPNSPWQEDSIWLRYSVNVTDQPGVFNKLKQQGVILGDWYWAPVVPTLLDYVSTSCPVAETVCKNIINLPTHINISPRAAEKIITLMKPYVTNH